MRERDREKGLPLLLVHPPMAATAGALRLAHHADPKPGARYLSWSPMGCRAQALVPSSTALPGHSRELAWKRGNGTESGALTGARTQCASTARQRISLVSRSGSLNSIFTVDLLVGFNLGGYFFSSL